ncbi:UNVERIFIED_ORG: hypothetical protein J2X79_002449 [Arthrobacter globiformis]|nr:hypothetical protein [Arthrobacter globiformis]
MIGSAAQVPGAGEEHAELVLLTVPLFLAGMVRLLA